MSDTYKPFGGREPDPTGEDGFTLDPNASVATFLGGTGGSDTGNDRGSARDAGGTEFDPSIHAGPDKFNNDGTFRKKRGRKSGSGNSGNRKQTYNQAGVEALTRMLGIVHLGIAAATKCPELALSDDDAEALSHATVNVLNEFDINPSPKTQAIVGLVMTAGSIYGPKAYMIKVRLKEDKNKDDVA